MVDRRALAITLLGGALVAGCRGLVGDQKADAKRYPWWPTESAPGEAPVFLIASDLILADGGTTYVPDKRMASKGWGTTGSLDLVGAKVKALPARVSLTWFSYLDDRFYAGQFAIARDPLEALFARGSPMPQPRKREPFDSVIFGMAPGGRVSIWAAAAQVVKEVARFHAAPVDLPWREVIATARPTRAEHIRQVLEERQTPAQVAAQRSPAGQALWVDYPRRLTWTPQLTGINPQRAIVWIKGLNGERDWADLADPLRGGEPLPAQLPMPASLTLIWQGADGSMSADIAMDPVEVVIAFKKLSAAGRPGPMTLVLDPARGGDTVDVLLRRGELAHRFKNNRVEVFGGA